MRDTFNRYNFHKNTFCVFDETQLSQIAHLPLGYQSKSGSSYYFTDDGVYRLSNHWGRAAGCKWRLQSGSRSEVRMRLGFAKWTAFHRNNETEKLYYIESGANGVQFQHKDNGLYDGQMLRSAAATTSRIRQIRNVLQSDAWTRHYPGKNVQQLKQTVINALIQTNDPLPQIKRALQH